MFQIVCFILSVCVGDGSFSTVEFCDVLSLLFTTAIPAILHCVYARYLDAAMYSRNTDILFHMLCVHPHVCVRACMWACVCLCIHACMRQCVCVCVYVCVCMCVCTCLLEKSMHNHDGDIVTRTVHVTEVVPSFSLLW